MKLGVTIYLGFMLLCTTNDHQLMKKKNDFLEIEFHSNETIEQQYMQLEFNSIQILKFSSNTWNGI
jgi:hypothetical protein